MLSRLTGLELTTLPLLTPEEEAELSSDNARREAGKDAAAEAALLASQPALPPPEPLDLDVRRIFLYTFASKPPFWGVFHPSHTWRAKVQAFAPSPSFAPHPASSNVSDRNGLFNSFAPPLRLPFVRTQVVITSPRHLGMHIDVSEAENRVVIRGVSPGGDFAKALPSNVRPARLIAAYWTGLNGHSLAALPVTRLIPLLRKLPRPVTLRLRLQPLQGPPPPSSSSARAPSPLPYVTSTLTFSEPSAGIRFKPSLTLPASLFVCGFTREEASPSTLLPAEASGSVTPGQVSESYFRILFSMSPDDHSPRLKRLE